MIKLLNKPDILDVPVIFPIASIGELEVVAYTPRPPPPPLHQSHPSLSVSLRQPSAENGELTIKTTEDILRIAPPKRHFNEEQLFLLNRAILALEVNNGEKLSPEQKNDIFSLWHKKGVETDQLDPQKKRGEYQTIFFEKAAKAKVPLGRALDWDALIEESKRQPLPPAGIFENEKNRRLILICELLQKFWGDAPFFISCRKAGQILGVSHETANKYLTALLGAKILELVCQGGLKKGQKIASRYKFNKLHALGLKDIARLDRQK